MQCPVCHGSGISPDSMRVGGLECGACKGLGYLADEEELHPHSAASDAVEHGPQAVPAALPATSSFGDPAAIKKLFDQLKDEYEHEKRRGVIDETQAHDLDQVLQSLGSLVECSNRDRSLDELLHERDQLNELMRDMLNRVRWPRFKALNRIGDGRAARVLAHLQEAKAALGADALRGHRAQGEHDRIFNLYYRFARLTSAAHAAAGDAAKLKRLEMEEVRSLMNEARWYARRHHLTLARPVWSREVVAQDPNLVFFNGPDAVRRRLAPLAEGLGLRLPQGSYPGADIGAAWWRDLSAASLAVFDLTARDPQLYYDLGVALALGTELLLLAEAGTRIEFDVVQEVQIYTDLAALERMLPDALDAALYRLGAVRATGSSLAASAAEAERLGTARTGDASLGLALRQVLGSAAEDPVALRSAMGAFVSLLGMDAPVLLYPRWPAAYPSPTDRRCFIIMPFRAHLEPTWRAIEAGCRQAGGTPVRGDEVGGQEIIASIWEEIGRATHLVVDLTDLNLNVFLELGIADALGRPTLLVGRDGTDAARLASVAKRRIYPYVAGTEATRLAPLVRNFVGGKASTDPGPGPLRSLLTKWLLGEHRTTS